MCARVCMSLFKFAPIVCGDGECLARNPSALVNLSVIFKNWSCRVLLIFVPFFSFFILIYILAISFIFRQFLSFFAAPLCTFLPCFPYHIQHSHTSPSLSLRYASFHQIHQKLLKNWPSIGRYSPISRVCREVCVHGNRVHLDTVAVGDIHAVVVQMLLLL